MLVVHNNTIIVVVPTYSAPVVLSTATFLGPSNSPSPLPRVLKHLMNGPLLVYNDT